MTEPQHISTHQIRDTKGEPIPPEPDGLCHCPEPLNPTGWTGCQRCHRLVPGAP